MVASGSPAMADPRWIGLYRAGGVAALLTAALIPFQMILFIGWPPPSGSVVNWFAGFEASPLHGLLSLDLVMMLEEVLAIAIVLALYAVLHQASESTMAVALGAWLVAIALFIGSNTAFEMLSLSGGYSAAATDAERMRIAAAGQAMLTSYWSMGTSFVFGYLLSSLAGVLVGVAMLRSGAFGRVAAGAAIAGNVLGVAIFIPGIGVGLSLVSVLILWPWWAIVGAKLIGFGRGGRDRRLRPGEGRLVPRPGRQHSVDRRRPTLTRWAGEPSAR